jgi:hypothetical protein
MPVYFAQDPIGGAIKIGCTNDVPARIRSLESHYGRSLALRATIEGDLEEERLIFERFAHLRFGRTEQFRPAADLMAFIGLPPDDDIDPDLVVAMVPVFRWPAAMPITIDLPSDRYAVLKELASEQGQEPSSFIRSVLEQIVAPEAQRRGIRLFQFPEEG